MILIVTEVYTKMSPSFVDPQARKDVQILEKNQKSRNTGMTYNEILFVRFKLRVKVS